MDVAESIQTQGHQNSYFVQAQQSQLLKYAAEVRELFKRQRELKADLLRHEQQLQQAASRFSESHESELQAIACEVHDRIGQTLIATFHNLQVLESLTRADARTHEVVVRTTRMIREAIRESRNVINEIYPPALDEFGLARVIEDDLRIYKEDTGVAVTTEFACPSRPPRAVELALYRIFHEGLINIRRHARNAKHIRVRLRSNSQGTALEIRDDGAGFDMAATDRDKKVGGLMSMRRRAEVTGGTFELESAPGKGTHLAVHIPANRVLVE